MATNGNTNHQEQWRESGGAPTDGPSTSSNTGSPSKDEVGWYFVQQYYTTLSKVPDKLHLFYNKRSQFVQGLEAELSPVAVGRQAIAERIKELDFHDCKVRVSNVDSQASYDNIVIQVIGEICNKSGEPKKFVQTFVLAQQPAGYFLLNDILRYVNEGEEETTEGAVSEPTPAVEMEAPQEPAVAAVAAEHALATDTAPQAEKAQPEQTAEVIPAAALHAGVVDKKLEDASSKAKDTPSTMAAEAIAETVPVIEEALGKTEEAEPRADPDKVAREIAEEEAKKPELSKDLSVSPATSRASAPEPDKPKGPPKPMSWASRAAAAVGVPVKPVVPLPKAAPPAAAPAQQRAAVSAGGTAPVPAQSKPHAAAAQPSENYAQTADKDAASEWRTAGADSKRQNRQLSTAAPQADKEGTLAYVKFVTDKVRDEDLRTALGNHGEMVYFDINRTKNCAFVEYAAVAGYQAAIGASPITVNGENIVVEPRRPKAGAYGGANNNQNRNSVSGRGRGFDSQRSGSQAGGRGGYTPRGRGGAPRGRGGAQATNA